MCMFDRVRMFLYTLALGTSNREVQEIFQHPGEIVNKYFTKVLKFGFSLAVDFIKLKYPEFLNTSC